MAAWMSPSLKGATTVWIASRPRGGVSITERSRKPPSDIFSVRGMGVADMVSTSTLALNFFSFSFAATPKRCSSSTIRSPRSWKPASFDSRRCVPIRMSTLPASVSARTFFCSRAERKRLTISTRSGNAAMRWLKVVKCWKARTVVGASTATCLPSCATLKAARMASSVLPYPTSPHSRRSMACGLSRSCLMSSSAVNWSGVSSNSNASSNSFCQGVSAL